MFKFLIIAFSVVFLNGFCTGPKSNNEQRMALMKKAVSAIKDYDTLQLYKIVDTSYCYDIYGSDGFLNIVDYVHNQLKACAADYKELKSINTPANATEYNLPFCRGKSANSSNKGFDLVFTFANYRDDAQVMFLDIKKHFSDADSLFSPPIKLN